MKSLLGRFGNNEVCLSFTERLGRLARNYQVRYTQTFTNDQLKIRQKKLFLLINVSMSTEVEFEGWWWSKQIRK